MRILIIPDSFKESVEALVVAKAIKKGFSSVFSQADFEILPVADGGEGTVEALIYITDGKKVEVEVENPLGKPVKAHYGIIHNHTVVLEVASSIGLGLLTNEEKNPMATSSYGVGQLIKSALDEGYKNFIIGLGGSSTNDGGSGMAQALGIQFSNKYFQKVPKGAQYLHQIAHTKISLDPRIKKCKFVAACDVNNPLLGPTGATYTYSSQKGAKEKDLPILEKNLKHFSSILQNIYKKQPSIELVPGSGAAGGLGAGVMAFLGAKLQSGFSIFNEQIQLEKYIEQADLIITGEGRLDTQTYYGKAIKGICDIATKHNKKVVAITGSNELSETEYKEMGLETVVTLKQDDLRLEYCIRNAESLIEERAKELAQQLMKSSVEQ